MRIICPNCTAHYEIAEDLIPVGGRDVQCSSCGTGWFQEAAPPDEAAPVAPAPDAAHPDAGADNPPVSDRTDPGDTNREENEAPPAPPVPANVPGPLPRRRPVDFAALDILQEERAREERLRAAEGRAAADSAPAAPPPDEVLTAPAPEPAAETTPAPVPAERADPSGHGSDARARLAAAASVARARARSADPDGRDDGEAGGTPPAASVTSPASDASPDAAAAPEAARSARRDLLPDIEEINSSLRPDDRVADAAVETRAPVPRDASSAFRAGFLIACAIALLLLGAYVFASPLAEAIPSLAPVLDDWVGWVTDLRVGLDGAVEAVLMRVAPEG